MREKLIELLRSNPTVLETAGKSATSLLRLADFLIANGVTIPVRCKDCKHYEPGFVRPYLGWCDTWEVAVNENGFCHHGERKV